MPCVDNAAASSLSMPAQPPSPEMSTANVLPVPGAGTSTIGRSFNSAAPEPPTCARCESLECGGELRFPGVEVALTVVVARHGDHFRILHFRDELLGRLRHA